MSELRDKILRAIRVRPDWLDDDAPDPSDDEFWDTPPSIKQRYYDGGSEVNLAKLVDLILPLIRQAQAEALEEFAERWHEWMIDDAPQTRGGAAYRARAVAGEYRERAAAYRVGEGEQ